MTGLMPSRYFGWLIVFTGAVFGTLVWGTVFGAEPLPWWGALLLLLPFALLLYLLGVGGTAQAATERGLNRETWTWVAALTGPMAVFVAMAMRRRVIQRADSSRSSGE